MSASTLYVRQFLGGSATFPNPVLAGSLIVVFWMGFSAPSQTVQDTQGTTYALKDQYFDPNIAGQGVGVWYANAASSAHLAVSSTAGSSDVVAVEIASTSGNPVTMDTLARASGAGSSLSFGPLAPTYASSVCFALAFLNGAITAGTSGWSVNSQERLGNFAEYLMTTSTAAQTPTGTQNSTGWAGFIFYATDQGTPSSIQVLQMNCAPATTTGQLILDVQVGNRVVFMIDGYTGTATAPNDNLGNTWVQDKSFAGTSKNASSWSTVVTVPGAMTSITPGGALTGGSFSAYELHTSSGNTIVVDQTSTGTGTAGTAINNGSVNTLFDNEIVISAGSVNGTVNGWTASWGTQTPGTANVTSDFCEFIVSNAKGTYTATGTQTGGTDWDGLVVSFTDQTNNGPPATDGNFQDLVSL